jgi:hypothetical protein
MKTQIIQLESHDDLISARDKMAWSKAPRILLVWPRKGRILDRELDLITLQRYAQSLGSQLGVVAGQPDVRVNAREVGLPVFSSAVQAQRSPWRRSKGRKRLSTWLVDKPKNDAAGLRQQRESLSAERVQGDRPWIRFGAFTLGVFAVIALMLYFFPSARLELSPVRQEQNLVLDLRASPAIAEANLSGGIPAYPISVTVEGSDQIASSGRTAIPNGFAEGEVEFDNLTADSLEIPAGTVITTLDNPPLRYETLNFSSLPAGVNEKGTVKVRALLPGSAGNASMDKLRAIEGDLGLQALVTNPKALRGGSDRFSPAPSEKDYQDLRTKLVDSMAKTAADDLAREVDAGKKILSGTIQVAQVLKETIDPPEGDPGDFAHLTLQVEYKAWYVLDADLQAVARSALDANRPDGFSAQSESPQVDFASEPVLKEDQAARWKVNVTRWVEADWNNQAAARSVVGMQPDQAAHFLQQSLSLASPAKIELTPKWWFRMPYLSFRIVVVRK